MWKGFIRRFQLGEGPSRGLLCDCELSDGPSFQALEILPKEYVQKLRVCPSSALIRWDRANESVSSLFICHLFPRANRRDKKWAHNENNTTGRRKKGLCVILRKGDNRKVTKASYRTWNKGADKNCLQSVMLMDFSVWFPVSDKLFRDSSSLVEKFILYNLLLSVFSDFRFFRQKTNFSSLSQ